VFAYKKLKNIISRRRQQEEKAKKRTRRTRRRTPPQQSIREDKGEIHPQWIHFVAPSFVSTVEKSVEIGSAIIIDCR
jgi:hypothetical protein